MYYRIPYDSRLYGNEHVFFFWNLNRSIQFVSPFRFVRSDIVFIDDISEDEFGNIVVKITPRNDVVIPEGQTRVICCVSHIAPVAISEKFEFTASKEAKIHRVVETQDEVNKSHVLLVSGPEGHSYVTGKSASGIKFNIHINFDSSN